MNFESNNRDVSSDKKSQLKIFHVRALVEFVLRLHMLLSQY